MADRGDTHYRVGSLNRWFVGSSLILLVSTLWMVLDDWYRPWKGYQREFRAMEVARAKAQMDSPEAQAIVAEEARLKAALAKAEQDLESQHTALETANKELLDLKGNAFKATEAEKKAKQVYNWERWAVEEYRLHHQEPEAK